MSEPFLILHKVRGEPAFDVAHKMECPCCAKGVKDIDDVMCDCSECDGEGYWWIVSTSGHRAYPLANFKVWDLCDTYPESDGSYSNWPLSKVLGPVEAMHWDTVPDHYACNDRFKIEVEVKRVDLLKHLGLAKEFVRRV